jgi:Flp pilus assembly protein TadG
VLNLHRFRIRRFGDDRGSFAVESAGFVLPALLVCVVIVAGAFNLSVARLDLETASAAAARAASLQRSPDSAATAARQTAESNLASRDITCADLSVTTDLSRWGRGGSVTVTVQCTVSMASLARMSGIRGSFTTTSKSTSPIDTFRHLALGDLSVGSGPGVSL